MMDRKAFERKVREIRHMLPTRSNGRNVKVLSEYSKAGQAVIESASRWKGNNLQQVYGRWSDEKQQAYDEVWDMFCNSSNGTAFSICSASTYSFSVSWVSDAGIHLVTKDTAYLVITNE